MILETIYFQLCTIKKLRINGSVCYQVFGTEDEFISTAATLDDAKAITSRYHRGEE